MSIVHRELVVLDWSRLRVTFVERIFVVARVREQAFGVPVLDTRGARREDGGAQLDVDGAEAVHASGDGLQVLDEAGPGLGERAVRQVVVVVDGLVRHEQFRALPHRRVAVELALVDDRVDGNHGGPAVAVVPDVDALFGGLGDFLEEDLDAGAIVGVVWVHLLELLHFHACGCVDGGATVQVHFGRDASRLDARRAVGDGDGRAADWCMPCAGVAEERAVLGGHAEVPHAHAGVAHEVLVPD